MDQQAFVEELDARIVVAERALTSATGGENVCKLAKTGQVTGGVKYDEGRLVALRAARRLVGKDSPAAEQAALQHLREKWRADLHAHEAREKPSVPWLAYAQGGVDALEQLLGEG